MEQLDFYSFNNLLLSSFSDEELSDENKIVLTLIGKVINELSEKEITGDIKLVVPTYNDQIVASTMTYVSRFGLLMNINKEEELKNYEDKFIVDIELLKKDNMVSSFWGFKEMKNNILKWGENTYTTSNQFLPVYSETTINKAKLKEDFLLFKTIKNFNLFSSPIRISTEKETLIITSENNRVEEKLGQNVELLLFNKEVSIGDEIKRLNEIKSLKNKFVITYPYYRNIRRVLIDRCIKNPELNLKIEFRSRFFLDLKKDIDESDLHVLPHELNCANLSEISPFNPSEVIEIIHTNHTKNLTDAITHIRDKWRNIDENIYTYPFPKYFLMFITSEKTKEEYVEMLIEAMPNLQRKDIYDNLVKIIEELRDINWIDTFLNQNDEPIHIVFPNLEDNRNRSKRLRRVFNTFKRYCIDKSENVSFGSCLLKNKKNIVLNGFDSLDAFNIIRSNPNKSIKFIYPDFLFYNYNPYIGYHIYQYQYRVYNSELRNNLSLLSEEQKDILNSERFSLLSSIKEQMRLYKERVKIEEEDILETGENNDFDEIEISEDEEIIKISEITKEEEIKKEFEISTSTGDVFSIFSDKDYYIKRQNLIRVKGGIIEVGDFILIDDLIDELVLDKVYLRLENIPDSVKNYQFELNQIERVFEKLKNQGLNIKTKSYFLKRYLREEPEFNPDKFYLPRRNDWETICSFLNISNYDMNTAFIARYKDNRKIRNLYEQIVGFIHENKLLAELNRSEIVKKVKTYFYVKMDFLNEDDKDDVIDSFIYKLQSDIDDYFVEIINIKTV